VSVELLSDPYTGNVRSFITYLDIDEEKNDALSLLENSQSGISTGLYNKATTERLVKEFLEKSNKNSAILILADMDNLKSINDNLGHGEGDRAIKAFADTLKEHFRPSDIIGRVGGDEFMIFLTDPISDTKLHGVIQALIRKITALRIGENDQISISGSFGVVRSTTNQASFKQLYQQADTALYQVKRNGKSDYAFYTPKMENDNYRYQRHGVLSLNRPEWLDAGELNLLLNAISSYFPIVVSVNLTQNSYYMMQYRHAEVKTIPEFGRFEELIDVVGQTFHPEDRASFLQDFSKENLLSAYRRGENHVRHEGRQREESLAYLWMKTELIFSPNNGSGDLLAVVIARPIEQERTERLKSLQLQKLLDLTAVSSFEYICLVHLEDRSFELFANDGQNTHSVPELGNFDLATQRIRDLHISQEEKEAYYAKANIETIIRRMKETGGHYRYRYVLEEGEREAEFFYYEPTHHELLMTVRHIYPT
ncbi:MAG: GGDEF domain-containing protein, partial [Anaerovoracaceae bacterium]